MLDSSPPHLIDCSERILNQNPHVRASVIFGRGRFNVGILIDPTDEDKFDPADEEKLIAYRNLIWYVRNRLTTLGSH